MKNIEPVRMNEVSSSKRKDWRIQGGCGKWWSKERPIEVVGNFFLDLRLRLGV